MQGRRKWLQVFKFEGRTEVNTTFFRKLERGHVRQHLLVSRHFSPVPMHSSLIIERPYLRVGLWSSRDVDTIEQDENYLSNYTTTEMHYCPRYFWLLMHCVLLLHELFSRSQSRKKMCIKKMRDLLQKWWRKLTKNTYWQNARGVACIKIVKFCFEVSSNRIKLLISQLLPFLLLFISIPCYSQYLMKKRAVISFHRLFFNLSFSSYLFYVLYQSFTRWNCFKNIACSWWNIHRHGIRKIQRT